MTVFLYSFNFRLFYVGSMSLCLLFIPHNRNRTTVGPSDLRSQATSNLLIETLHIALLLKNNCMKTKTRNRQYENQAGNKKSLQVVISIQILARSESKTT